MDACNIIIIYISFFVTFRARRIVSYRKVGQWYWWAVNPSADIGLDYFYITHGQTGQISLLPPPPGLVCEIAMFWQTIGLQGNTPS